MVGLLMLGDFPLTGEVLRLPTLVPQPREPAKQPVAHTTTLSGYYKVGWGEPRARAEGEVPLNYIVMICRPQVCHTFHPNTVNLPPLHSLPALLSSPSGGR